MAQPSVSTYFKKRKNGNFHVNDDSREKTKNIVTTAPFTKKNESVRFKQDLSEKKKNIDIVPLQKADGARTNYERSVKKRTGVPGTTQLAECLVSPKKLSKTEVDKSQTRKESEAMIITADTDTPKNNSINIEKVLKTPTKQIIKASATRQKSELNSQVRKELNFNEVKTKITRSAKLQELKASLGRLQELEKLRKTQEEENKRLKEQTESPSNKVNGLQLKEFDSIELEVLNSPSKTFKTPTKVPPPTPDKHELMSPKHTKISKILLFSPSKERSSSTMLTIPAYQRFKYLAETIKTGQLVLPLKFRNLIDIFKAMDSVCAMFFNRRECITFKKLKPAVQRMLRKNLTEKHLAQIKHIYPDAYTFTQMKIRNYGSSSKTDYFQLVITPKVEANAKKEGTIVNENDEDNLMTLAQNNAMNPHVMTRRVQRLQDLLLEYVKEEHDKFLKSLDPPLSINKEKLTRWHPDFDLENCPDIEMATLPQPPNVDKYSSAKDILSTARNLFNCATPIEKSLQRYEVQLKFENDLGETSKDIEGCRNAVEATANADNSANSKLLKGVPKALLDKIRARQAAKALDTMTRRPSQDQESTKYSRLPELARHLRNVFITERRGVLAQDIIIKKIQNSYRTYLSPSEIEQHFQLLAKEIPAWLAFHEVRKTMYLKINKEMDLTKVIDQLEKVAKEKSKL